MRNKLGIWIQQEREKRGLSQSTLARLAGLNRAVINKIENDLVQPRPETLIAIAKGLNIPRLTVFRAVGWIEESTSNVRLDEADYILSMLENDDLEEIIQIAKLKLERQKAQINKQTSRNKKPARSALIEQ